MNGTFNASDLHIEKMPLDYHNSHFAPVTARFRTITQIEKWTPATITLLSRLAATKAALLIKNSNISGPKELSDACQLILPGLSVFSTGEHPIADQNRNIYQTINYAPSEKLLWHHENSFNQTWPKYIAFCSASPASSGGHTVIADGHLIYSAVDSKARHAFEDNGVTYTRFFHTNVGRSWKEVYSTSNWLEAKEKAIFFNEQLENKNSVISITCTRPAFIMHGNKSVWFNQILHWHPAALPERIRALTRQRLIPKLRNSSLGNGEEIEEKLIATLLNAYKEHEYAINWDVGDLLIIDNTKIAHGRNPYKGERKHFVKMLGVGSF